MDRRETGGAHDHYFLFKGGADDPARLPGGAEARLPALDAGLRPHRGDVQGEDA